MVSINGSMNKSFSGDEGWITIMPKRTKEFSFDDPKLKEAYERSKKYPMKYYKKKTHFGKLEIFQCDK